MKRIIIICSLWLLFSIVNAQKSNVVKKEIVVNYSIKEIDNALAEFDHEQIFNYTDHFYNNVDLWIKEDVDIVLKLSHYLLDVGQYKKTEYFLKQIMLKASVVSNQQYFDAIKMMSVLYWAQGESQKALESQNAVVAYAEHNFGQDEIKLAEVYQNSGLFLMDKYPEKALNYFLFCDSIYLKKNIVDKLVYNKINIASYYRKVKDYEKAIAELEDLLLNTDFDNAKGLQTKAFVLSNIALIYYDKNEFQQAISFWNKSVVAYETVYGKKNPEIANVYMLISDAYLKQFDTNAASISIQKAIIANSYNFEKIKLDENAIAVDVINLELGMNVFLHKAKILEVRYREKSSKLNDLKNALIAIDIADSLVHKLRQERENFNDKLKVSSLSHEIYESGIRLSLLVASGVLNKEMYFEKALGYCEKSKNATLSDALKDAKAKSFAGIPDTIIQEELLIKSKILQLEKEIKNIIEHDVLIKKTNELNAAKEKFYRYVTKLETDYPKYFNLKYQIHDIDFEKVKKKISPNEALVSYFISENDQLLYVFFIDNKSIKVYSQQFDVTFSRNIKGLRNGVFLKNNELVGQTSKFIYNKCFPFKITKDKYTFIQDGFIHGVPFEALKTNSGEYLIQKAEVNYHYAIAIWLEHLNEKTTTKEVLLYAPVQFDNNRIPMTNLPDTKVEVNEIESILANKNVHVEKHLYTDANEMIVSKTMERTVDCIHMATHGAVDAVHPELSRVYLYYDSTLSKDGLLYAGEIYGLKLNAKLMTLSACETGLGKVAKGEGLIGLSRALLYAGIDDMVVSLWKVSDEATMELMKLFYANVVDNDYATALRNAKLEMIKSKKYSDPYYWAAFIQIGK